MATPTRYCRECGEEFRAEVVHCSDCGGLLEDWYGDGPPGRQATRGTPEAPVVAGAEDEFTVVLRASSSAAVKEAADVLAAVNVRFRVAGNSGGYDLLAHVDDYAVAQGALAGREGAISAVPEPSQGSSACPACATPALPGQAECAECGLALEPAPRTCRHCGCASGGGGGGCSRCGAGAE